MADHHIEIKATEGRWRYVCTCGGFQSSTTPAVVVGARSDLPPESLCLQALRHLEAVLEEARVDLEGTRQELEAAPEAGAEGKDDAAYAVWQDVPGGWVDIFESRDNADKCAEQFAHRRVVPVAALRAEKVELDVDSSAGREDGP